MKITVKICLFQQTQPQCVQSSPHNNGLEPTVLTGVLGIVAPAPLGIQESSEEWWVQVDSVSSGIQLSSG